MLLAKTFHFNMNNCAHIHTVFEEEVLYLTHNNIMDDEIEALGEEQSGWSSAFTGNKHIAHENEYCCHMLMSLGENGYSSSLALFFQLHHCNKYGRKDKCMWYELVEAVLQNAENYKGHPMLNSIITLTTQ